MTVLCSEVIVAAFYSDHSTFYTTKYIFKKFSKNRKNCISIKLFLKLIRLYKQKGKYTMCIGPVKLRKRIQKGGGKQGQRVILKRGKMRDAIQQKFENGFRK